MLRHASLVLLVVAVVGCGKRPEVLYPVAGQVTVDGVPLVGGPRCYVVFQPLKSKGNDNPNEPKSTIDGDGHYRLTTITRDGARPGWYRVRVDAAEVIDIANPYVTNWLVAKKYIDFTTSGIELEVVEAPAPGAYDLRVTK